MKKINELKEERANLIAQMEVITRNEELTDELRSEFDGLETKIETLTKDIARAEKVDAANKLIAERTLETPEVEETMQKRYVNALVRFFNGDGVDPEFRGYKNGLELRADFLTSTDAGLVIKDMETPLNIAKTPPLLAKIGAKKLPNMKGQFDLTAMAETNAQFVGETVAVQDASAAPTTPVTLAPRRLGSWAVVSMEALDSTKPAVWAGIVQDLLDAWDRKVSSDAMTQLIADTVDASTDQAGTNLAYADIIGLQANIPYDMANPVYLTTPAIAAKLAATVSLTGVEGPVWKGNVFQGTMAGLPAFASSDVPANHLIFVDAAKITTAEFRPKTLLNNPFEYDVEGKLKVTVSGEVDSGFRNYRFVSYIPDCSVA